MKARHEGQVGERKFQVGKLVWKIAPHVRRVAGVIKHKFSSKWDTSNRTLLAKGPGKYKGV